MIYVLCPPNSVTGGPDALHQMVYYLNRSGIPAKIAYMMDTTLIRYEDIAIPEPYRCYVGSFMLDTGITDTEEDAVVIPEAFSSLARRYRRAKVFIWWLSVDNNHVRDYRFRKLLFLLKTPFFFAANRKNLKRAKQYYAFRLHNGPYRFGGRHGNTEHLCASHYAYDYVSSRTDEKVLLCIEPISKAFLDAYRAGTPEGEREQVVLYNPRKSMPFVEQFTKHYPDIPFLPLTGMTQQELIEKYRQSMVYLDFGPFPGAERMPKEAVLFGCVVITGRNGASAFYEDVVIGDAYKFGNDEYSAVYGRIRDIFGSYETAVKDMADYRRTVLSLETAFETSLRSVFGCL